MSSPRDKNSIASSSGQCPPCSWWPRSDSVRGLERSYVHLGKVSRPFRCLLFGFGNNFWTLHWKIHRRAPRILEASTKDCAYLYAWSGEPCLGIRYNHLQTEQNRIGCAAELAWLAWQWLRIDNDLEWHEFFRALWRVAYPSGKCIRRSLCHHSWLHAQSDQRTRACGPCEQTVSFLFLLRRPQFEVAPARYHSLCEVCLCSCFSGSRLFLLGFASQWSPAQVYWPFAIE